MIHPRLLVAYLLVSILTAACAFTPANKQAPAPIHSASMRSEHPSDVDIIDRRKSLSRFVTSGLLGIVLIDKSTCGIANAATAAKTEVSTTVTSKVGASLSISTAPAPPSNSYLAPSKASASSTPATAPKSNNKLDNPGDVKNCPDFATYREAKEWFDKYYDLYGDVAKLDKNNNGIPCESLPGAPVFEKKN
mmetsp:Transcript_30118/g.63430  ORF Transcript_30118/g.63430 Transcript_30118/m.63430 type:complete len:192 (-) Transcript_30118:3609-4184(-)